MSSCIVTQGDCFSYFCLVTNWHDMVLLYCHTKRLNNVMAFQTIHPTEHITIVKHDTIILLCLVSDNTVYDKDFPSVTPLENKHTQTMMKPSKPKSKY